MNQAASTVRQRKGTERGQEDKNEGKSVTSGKWKATGGPGERDWSGAGGGACALLVGPGGDGTAGEGRGVRQVFMEGELKGEWEHPARKAPEARSRGLQRREDRVRARGAYCWGQVTSCNVGTDVITRS